MEGWMDVGLDVEGGLLCLERTGHRCTKDNSVEVEGGQLKNKLGNNNSAQARVQR